jgi:hypothetical protein
MKNNIGNMITFKLRNFIESVTILLRLSTYTKKIAITYTYVNVIIQNGA